MEKVVLGKSIEKVLKYYKKISKNLKKMWAWQF